MTPEMVRASYRRALAQFGETITLKRPQTSGTPDPTYTAAAVLARVAGYAPEQLVGGIQQGDREAIVLAEDLVTLAWPVPPRRGDRAVLANGRDLHVEHVDDQTLKIGATVIGYKIRLRG